MAVRKRKRATGYAARRQAQKRAAATALLCERTPHVPLSDEVHSTECFEKYYTAQKIVCDDEWGALLAALHRPLPVTFRFNPAASTVGSWQERWAQVKPPGAIPLPVPGAWQLQYFGRVSYLDISRFRTHA